MILFLLALSLHTFSLIPLVLEDGLYTSKPLYHNKRCYLTHTPLFTSKKITFYIVFLDAGAIYHRGPKKKRIQMLTTNGKPTRRLINRLLRPQVSEVTRTKFLPDQQPQIPL